MRSDARKRLTGPTCVAVIAHFVRWSQECREPAPHVVNWDDNDWPVCDEHLAAFNAQNADPL